MRFVHTSDWHLGRLFHGVHMTDDQAHVLDQLVDLLKDCRAQALVIAGDIYDRAVPPPDAVTLLDDVLTRVAVDLEVPVLMIAGNHDSPERVGFGSRVLCGQKVHVGGALDSKIKTVVLTDEHGKLLFHLIPYAEPAVVKEKLGDERAIDHCTSMQIILDKARMAQHSGCRSVVVAHAFVAGGKESESERPLSVGGSGAVDASHFTDFTYVALGHLHRPQHIGAHNISYSGSLLKYSFAEADHKKHVNLVEISAGGQVKVEEIALSPRRDVRCIAGHLDDIVSGRINGGSKEDYLEVTLLDRGAILDPIGKLRAVYPNVLHLRRTELSTKELASGYIDHRKISDFQLFCTFFAEATGDSLTDEQQRSYRQAVEKMHCTEREVAL